MKVSIIGRQMNVWDEMKITIENKLSKLDKYFDDECTATATLSSKRNQKCLERKESRSVLICMFYKDLFLTKLRVF